MVTINGKQYNAHFSLRAQMIWETVYERPFSPKTTSEVWLYYYCVLVACNIDKDMEKELPMDDFLDAVEKDQSIVGALISATTSDLKKKNHLKRLLEKILSLFQ